MDARPPAVLSGHELDAAQRLAALAGVSTRLAAVPADELEAAISDGLDDLVLHLPGARWTLVLDDGTVLGRRIDDEIVAMVERTLASTQPIVLGPGMVGVTAFATGRAVAVLVLVLERDDVVLLDPPLLGLLRAVGDLVAAALARRNAEEAARRADDRYRRLLDTSAEGVCLLAADGTIAGANRSFGALVGVAPSALIGAPIRRFLSDADADATALASRLLHETTRFEVELQAADGNRRWVSCATSALRDDADDALALVMMTDISVRRAAEAALRNSEARFRALVRSSSDVILVTNDRGIVAYASPAVRDVLGHEPATLLGRSPLELVHPDDLADVRARATTLWQDRSGSLVLRCRVVTSSAGYRTMEAALTNLIDDEAVAGITITARDISEQVELHASLAHAASHDQVTGLPNRRVFERRLHEALRSGPARVAVLFGDLDGFKAVNDELGHDVGDELLRAVGHRLRQAVRDRDLVARYGGDEFAVLCTGVQRPAVAARVAERVVAALATPIVVGGLPVRVGISVGVALAPVRGRMPARQLLASADAAMYEAKASGNGWRHARPVREPIAPSPR